VDHVTVLQGYQPIRLWTRYVDDRMLRKVGF